MLLKQVLNASSPTPNRTCCIYEPFEAIPQLRNKHSTLLILLTGYWVFKARRNSWPKCCSHLEGSWRLADQARACPHPARRAFIRLTKNGKTSSNVKYKQPNSS